MSRQHALITGGSSGIGLALAEELIKRGWSVTLLARDRKKLEDAQQQLEQKRPDNQQQVHILSADVSDAGAAQAAVDSACGTLGVPDLVVLSAGIAIPGYFEEIEADVHHQSMAINYFGSLYTVQAVTPYLRERGSGCICFVSSGAGLVGLFGYASYSPSKFAVRGLAEVLRAELRQHGIQVSIVYPPDTDTPQLVAENKTKPAETKALTAGGGLWQAPELARVVLKEIERRRFVIAPGTQMRLLARWHSLLAPVLWRYFDRVAARAAAKRGA